MKKIYLQILGFDDTQERDLEIKWVQFENYIKGE